MQDLLNQLDANHGLSLYPYVDQFKAIIHCYDYKKTKGQKTFVAIANHPAEAIKAAMQKAGFGAEKKEKSNVS